MRRIFVTFLVLSFNIFWIVSLANAQTWQTSGSNIYYQSGTVGIGTKDTSGYSLNIHGKANIDSSIVRSYMSADNYVVNDYYITGSKLYQHGVLPKQREKGMIIPMYKYPSFYEDPDSDGRYNQEDKDWWFRKFIDALKKHPEVKPIVIVNPNDGPGSQVDGNYVQAIQWLRGSGATVIGYISTQYSEFDPDNSGTQGLTEKEVTNQIDTWYNLYPEIDGVFFDEAPYEVTSTAGKKALQQYINSTNYLHKNYEGLSVGNPGQRQENNDYYDNNAFDILITFEQSALPSGNNVSGAYSYPETVMENNPHRKAVMIYSQGAVADSTIRRSITEQSMYADYFWVWNDDTWGSGGLWNGNIFASYVNLVAEALNAPKGNFYIPNGGLFAKEITVSESMGADFVFNDDYDLPDLMELETKIRQDKHLPGIPSAKEMRREGVDVGALQIKLLQKIEELTLYVIKVEKRNQSLIDQLSAVDKRCEMKEE